MSSTANSRSTYHVVTGMSDADLDALLGMEPEPKTDFFAELLAAQRADDAEAEARKADPALDARLSREEADAARWGMDIARDIAAGRVKTCTRCSGNGVLGGYEHIAGGMCFKCGGAGLIRD